MATINRTDRLFVTISHGGTNLYSTEMSGLSTIGEVYLHIKKQADIEPGMVTLHLRNSTQGWSQQHNFVLKNGEKTKENNIRSKAANFYPSLFDSFT